jgi:autotransporter translocation and assembly factor TamB
LTLNTSFQNADDYLILNGSVNHDISLTWKLHINELSDIFMNLSGSATSDGTITKRSNSSNIQASLDLSGYSVGNINIDDINIKINGTFDKHTITIDSTMQQAKTSSILVGKVGSSPLSWSGTINQCNVSSPNLGSWKLSKPASLSFSPTETKIDTFQLLSEKKEQFLLNFLWSQTHRTLQGKMEFNMNELPLPFLNITLKQLKGDVSASGQSANFVFSALSEGSPINWTGSGSWQHTLELKTHLSGDNILIIDTSEYMATASPDLTLLIQKNRRIDLTGDIIIPKATITPDNFISVVSLPSDVEFVGIQEKKPSIFKFYSNVNLILGDHITLNTQGIQGDLQGQLAIIKAPDQPFVGNGTLSIANASYNIFGQKLTITKGHLNFVNSTLANPNLDIQASRSFATSLSSSSFGVERLTVGANLSGTLKRPQISLFSQPVQLSDMDILSYLLFGSSAGGAEGTGGPASNALILLQIANSLKSGKNTGDTGFIQKLQSGLRLTEFGVQTQTDVDAVGNIVSSNEQIVAGAYLSPKLYFRYRYDLFDEENIFEAQYLLSKNWIVQTNTSASGNGADILYTIERGK